MIYPWDFSQVISHALEPSGSANLLKRPWIVLLFLRGLPRFIFWRAYVLQELWTCQQIEQIRRRRPPSVHVCLCLLNFHCVMLLRYASYSIYLFQRLRAFHQAFAKQGRVGGPMCIRSNMVPRFNLIGPKHMTNLVQQPSNIDSKLIQHVAKLDFWTFCWA